MNEKLEKLFFELDEGEINSLCLSQKAVSCETDTVSVEKIKSNVINRLNAFDNEKGRKRTMKAKKLTITLIAAVLAVVLAISGGAAFKFILPKKALGDNMTLERISAVVDTQGADESSIRTINKTVVENGYTLTFEAIADVSVIRGGIICPDGNISYGEVSMDKYAVFTLSRDDGKQVLFGDDEKSLYPSSMAYLLLVDDYMPNPNMFVVNTEIWTHEENNVLYILCNITEAQYFADHELSLAFSSEDTLLTADSFERDENGKYTLKSATHAIKAIFDFSLDDALADKEVQDRYMAQGTFIKAK